MTRLAVIDTSSAAGQPMGNEDGTVWIVYNGEVYNYRELRGELSARGHRFRSASDTEVVLHAYEQYGEECLQKLRGMYAFAIWDGKLRKLCMAVDRLGVKPLYYARFGSTFLFGSEIKAILQHPDARREIDKASLAEYLRYGYVPAPRTIFQSVQRLLPGHQLIVQGEDVRVKQYWDLSFRPEKQRSEQDWIEDTRDLLSECVRDQMESDVPLGALLSGGVDSSSIVAFMSQCSTRRVKTFTIGFNSKGRNYGHYDETMHARTVADRFDCDHHELVVEPDVLDILPHVVWHFDEPFANITAIPTWYLSQMTRQHVTVALAGVGGDEDFGGYPRYLAARCLPAFSMLPAVLRDGLKRLATALPPQPDRYSALSRVRRFFLGAVGRPEFAYRNWVSLWKEDDLRNLFSPSFQNALDTEPVQSVVDRLMAGSSGEELLNRIFYVDLKSYLPDNLLTYCDRMASAHGLEMRVPFCDHRLVEFAATIPPALKMKGFTLKYILKRALHGLIPKEELYRRKQGFSVPLARWLQDGLLPAVSVMLSPEKVARRGYFHAPTIQMLLDEHGRGKADHSAQLWSLLVFEVWHTLYLDTNCLSEPTLSLREWASL